MFNLILIPYAGGMASVYNRWKGFLDKHIGFFPVELAGRGRRFKDAFYNTLEEAVEDVYCSIKDKLDLPYAIFGHSMGGAIAYELYNRIKYENNRLPFHMFVSGRRPPHIRSDEKQLHLLTDDEFEEEIMKIGGTPKEIFDDNELSKIFIPILKADYKIIENYEYKPNECKLGCGITAFTGKFDNDVMLHDIVEWNIYTDCEFNLYVYNGGHFFINDNIAEITGVINREIAKLHMQ